MHTYTHDHAHTCAHSHTHWCMISHAPTCASSTGQGMPRLGRARGRADEFGDLVIKFVITFPSVLSPEKKEEVSRALRNVQYGPAV